MHTEVRTTDPVIVGRQCWSLFCQATISPCDGSRHCRPTK